MSTEHSGSAANPAKLVEKRGLPTRQDNPADFIPREEFKLTDPLWGFLAYTGLRIEEAISLTWPDIREGYVLARKGKGSKTRVVPLVYEAQEALRSLPRAIHESKVFLDLNSRATAARRFRRALKAAGMD